MPLAGHGQVSRSVHETFSVRKKEIWAGCKGGPKCLGAIPIVVLGYLVQHIQ